MSCIKIAVDNLGGWEKALSMVKPSTSTSVMMATLVVLVAFFPENQWGFAEEESYNPAKSDKETSSSVIPTPKETEEQAPEMTVEETTNTPTETVNTSVAPETTDNVEQGTDNSTGSSDNGTEDSSYIPGDTNGQNENPTQGNTPEGNENQGQENNQSGYQYDNHNGSPVDGVQQDRSPGNDSLEDGN